MRLRIPKLSRWRVLAALGVLVALVVALCIAAEATMLRMPGRSYPGARPPLTDVQKGLRDELRKDVQKLAGEIGERNIVRYKQLVAAAEYIERSFSSWGYHVGKQTFEVSRRMCENIDVEIPGTTRANEIVIIGGHYDSIMGGPGANDNGTGVSAVLALARLAREDYGAKKPARTIRFVAFANEEPPFFPGKEMGSAVYARRCRERGENIVAMMSIETIGYYSDRMNSQFYPPFFRSHFPPTGDFIAFVGNLSSRELVRRAVWSFRRHEKFPSEGIAMPAMAPGAAWSDHSSFWHQGYRGLMVTDTAPYRYPYYHTKQDTPDKVDYERLARVVDGLRGVVSDFANP
jgi:Zn-dependent M28 family amino/carboxypeptidase